MAINLPVEPQLFLGRLRIKTTVGSNIKGLSPLVEPKWEDLGEEPSLSATPLWERREQTLWFLWVRREV